MICDPCKRGDHCGETGAVGQRSGMCPCQHRPPGAWRGQRAAVAYATVKVDVDPALIARCQDTDDCCPPDACRLDAAREALGAPLTAVPPMAVRLDPDPTTPSAEDGTRPFVVVLADWMRLHRAGRFGEASVLRRALIGRLDREPRT
jgi:hypothetical protein